MVASETIAPEWRQAAAEHAAFLTRTCAPPSSEPTETFAEKCVEIQDGPMAGSKFRPKLAPLVHYIFEAMRKPHVRRVVLMLSAQYVKTTALLCDFLRRVKHEPADCMWVMAEADHITEFIAKRLVPYIEGCEGIGPGSFSKSRNLLRFDGMNLLLRGSNSTSKLQSDPIQIIYCDERREWKAGAIEKLRMRLRTFSNSLEISAGVPGKEADELDRDYREGSQTRMHFHCPACGRSQPIRFGRDVTALWPEARTCGGFVWDKNDETKPGGVWDYEKVRPTVRYECENPDCKHLMHNKDKAKLISTFHPHDYNPGAPPQYVSFNGSAFEAVWEACDWDLLVVGFLKAVDEAKRGNTEPLKTFITETMGEPLRAAALNVQDRGFLELLKAPYAYGEAWAEEKRRFLAADKQEKGGEHYYWLIRAFGMAGQSRLVAHGTCKTYAELLEVAKNYNVPAGASSDCIIDSGFRAQEVYRFCLATGWRAFKGDQVPEYFVSQPDPRAPQSGRRITVRQLWRKTRAAVYHAQTRARITQDLPLITFASDPINDLLAEFLMKVTGDFTIPENVSRQYLDHMMADKLVTEKDNRGVIQRHWETVDPNNHWRDCERMITVRAMTCGLISGPVVVKGETQTK